MNVERWWDAFKYVEILIEHVSDDGIANPSKFLNGGKSFGKCLTWSNGPSLDIRW